MGNFFIWEQFFRGTGWIDDDYLRSGKEPQFHAKVRRPDTPGDVGTHAVLKRETGELESRQGDVLGEELPPMGMAGEDEISIPVGPAFRLMDQV